MKIVHIYARNLKVFEEALEGTGCKINGSCHVNLLERSLANFNVRDVLGLVVFRRVMSKKTLKLIHTFDSLFVFKPLPIVIVCDDAVALVEQRKVTTKHCPLYALNSEEGTISDVDMNRIFTTLACWADEIYNLEEVEHKNKETLPERREKERKGARTEAEEVLAGLRALEEGAV